MDESAPFLTAGGIPARRRRRRPRAGNDESAADAACCAPRECCGRFRSSSACDDVHGWDDINLKEAEAKQIHRLKDHVKEAYDHGVAEEERLWERLWAALSGVSGGAGEARFPGHVSPRWRDVGFQQDDPRADLRSSGKLGLTQLVVFAEANSDFCQSYMAACPSLPLCAVGLNMTYNLTHHLLLHSSTGASMPLYGGTNRVAGGGPSKDGSSIFGNIPGGDKDLEFRISPGGDRADLIAFVDELSSFGNGLKILQVFYDMAFKAVLKRWKALGGGGDTLLLLNMQSRVYPAGWKAVEAYLLAAS